jgi:hypothetical protein
MASFRLLLASFALFLLVLLSACRTADPAPESGVAFTGGSWFDGRRFVQRREVYVADGVLTLRRPRHVESTVDLSGRFIVPPYGDAHSHHFEALSMVEAINRTYLAEGIFYGVSMTNFISAKARVLETWSRADTVDIAWADAGLTSSYGHPIMVYETLARNSVAFDKSAVWMADEPKAEGRGYFIIDTAADLEAKWPQVLASRPDLLKIFLLYSENYEPLRQPVEQLGDRGLDPRLVPQIVERAGTAGLRVAAHVETAFDFRTAVRAGVAVIAHLPGYHVSDSSNLDAYRLTEADAAEAARRGVVVVPTPLRAVVEPADNAAEAVRALQFDNIGMLRKHGVRLAAGADAFGTSSRAHIEELRNSGIFTNLELLQIWSIHTPQVAFPERRIGSVTPGSEASFLVLRRNPLEDFEATAEIILRVKQGRLLD